MSPGTVLAGTSEEKEASAAAAADVELLCPKKVDRVLPRVLLGYTGVNTAHTLSQHPSYVKSKPQTVRVSIRVR